jgi:hypothetical protein
MKTTTSGSPTPIRSPEDHHHDLPNRPSVLGGRLVPVRWDAGAGPGEAFDGKAIVGVERRGGMQVEAIMLGGEPLAGGSRRVRVRVLLRQPKHRRFDDGQVLLGGVAGEHPDPFRGGASIVTALGGPFPNGSSSAWAVLRPRISDRTPRHFRRRKRVCYKPCQLNQ